MSPIYTVRTILETLKEAIHLEPPDSQGEERRQRRAQFLQIMTVVTALLVAIVGLLDGYASRGVDESAVQVQRLGVNSTAAFRHAQQDAQVQLETFALAQEFRIRQATAQQQLLATDDPHTMQRLGLDVVRWNTLAEAVEKRSSLTRDTFESPEQDPKFPDRFFAKTWEAREHEFALQDAAIEEFTAWRHRVDLYAAALPMLAVALSLFGLALGARTEARNAFLWVGVVLFAGGTTLAVAVSVPLTPPAASEKAHQESEAAAVLFGRAVSAFQRAADQSDYQAARGQFDDVVMMRPRFGYAYFYRGEAAYSSGSPVAGAPVVSVTRFEDLMASKKDLLLAIERHVDNEEVHRSLGNTLFQLALREDDPVTRSNLLKQSIAETSTALRKAPAQPRLHYNPMGKYLPLDPSSQLLQLLRYNLAVALLAAGHADQAESEIKQALEPVKKTMAKDREEALDAYVGGALTDLTKVLRASPGMERQVIRMKEYIIAQLSGAPRPAKAPASGVHIDVTPIALKWSAHLPGFQPENGDVLFAVWYYVDPREKLEDQEWSVLPVVSGRVLSFDRHGEEFSHLTRDRRCLRSGRYRLEIYVNGHLVAGDETKAQVGDLNATVSQDQNMAMCLPKEWTRSKDKSVIGFIEGHVSPDHTSGAFMYRYQHPRLGEPPEAVRKFYLNRTLADLRPLFPKAPSNGKECTSRPFLVVQVPRVWYRYPGGCMLARATVRPNGSVLVSLVFGPTGYFATREPIDIYESMGTFNEP
jgi:tetratricopeptide (TPR) repeat protein